LTCWLLSQFCGTDLLNSTPGFNETIEALAASTGSSVPTPPVPASAYAQAQALYPHP
jgi:hypothetical protein